MSNHSKIVTYLLATGSVGLALLMIRYPETAVHASFEGLEIWWKSVFPALFPFFVLSELMIGFGVVKFAGTLLEPIMRPVFKVPGIGGFVLMMGMVSGFPAGARITASLYKQKQLTKIEAERLSSFTNFSNPLFLFSVTAVQFFHQIALGIVFALAHYAGNIATGCLMRFYKKRNGDRSRGKYSFSLFVKALQNMHEERINHYRPFGSMLGDAVSSSVSTLLAVGGFIALFSMIYQLLNRVGLNAFAGMALSHLFSKIGLAPSLGPASVPGIFELTIGAHAIGAAPAPMIERVIIVSALLGFCGFSVQAQAVSILSQAGLSVRPFLIGRIFQSLFSGFFAWILYSILNINSHLQTSAVFALSEPLCHYSDNIFSIGPWITAGALILSIILSWKQLRHPDSFKIH